MLLCFLLCDRPLIAAFRAGVVFWADGSDRVGFASLCFFFCAIAALSPAARAVTELNSKGWRATRGAYLGMIAVMVRHNDWTGILHVSLDQPYCCLLAL